MRYLTLTLLAIGLLATSATIAHEPRLYGGRYDRSYDRPYARSVRGYQRDTNIVINIVHREPRRATFVERYLYGDLYCPGRYSGWDRRW